MYKCTHTVQTRIQGSIVLPLDLSNKDLCVMSCTIEGVIWPEVHETEVTCHPGAHASYAPGTKDPRMTCSDGPQTNLHGLCEHPPQVVFLTVGMLCGCKHLQTLGGTKG